MLKKEKAKFGVGHAKLIEDLERLDKAHKALESEHSLLLMLHYQPQPSKLFYLVPLLPHVIMQILLRKF